MIRLLIDENFDHDILRGLLLRVPNLDSVTTQAAGLRGAADRVLLNGAVAEQGILVTHDLNTVPKLAYETLESRCAFGWSLRRARQPRYWRSH